MRGRFCSFFLRCGLRKPGSSRRAGGNTRDPGKSDFLAASRRGSYSRDRSLRRAGADPPVGRDSNSLTSVVFCPDFSPGQLFAGFQLEIEVTLKPILGIAVLESPHSQTKANRIGCEGTHELRHGPNDAGLEGGKSERNARVQRAVDTPLEATPRNAFQRVRIRPMNRQKVSWPMVPRAPLTDEISA